MRDMHEYLFEFAKKELAAFGKEVGAERIRKNLELWEQVYGDQVADKARKLIVAEWRKRYRTSGHGVGSQGRVSKPHQGGGGDPEVPADAGVQSA